MILNVVVYAVLCHWLLAVEEAEGEAGTGGFGRYIQRLEAYFYVDDDLLAHMRVEKLQRVFFVLTELFYWVGMCTNVGKRLSMECQLCRSLGGHYTEAYGLDMMGGDYACTSAVLSEIHN